MFNNEFWHILKEIELSYNTPKNTVVGLSKPICKHIIKAAIWYNDEKLHHWVSEELLTWFYDIQDLLEDISDKQLKQLCEKELFKRFQNFDKFSSYAKRQIKALQEQGYKKPPEYDLEKVWRAVEAFKRPCIDILCEYSEENLTDLIYKMIQEAH